MKRILLTLILLQIGSAVAQTQVIFDETKPLTYLFKQQSGGVGQSTINYFIGELAKSSGKSISNTEFQIGLNTLSRITRISGNQLQAKIQLKDFKVTGDNSIKSFMVNNELLPSTISYLVELSRDNNLINSQNFISKIVMDEAANLSSEAAIWDFTDSMNSNTYKLAIKNVVFNYDYASENKFKSKLDKISDYYSSIESLTSIASRLTGISTTDLDNMDKNNAALNEIVNQLMIIKNKNFESSLNLSSKDPMSFVNLFNTASNAAGKLKELMKTAMENIHQLYYIRGTEYLSAGKQEEAVGMFNKSSAANASYVPPQYQLAKISFGKGNIDDAAAKVQSILTAMSPDANFRQYSFDLAKAINTNYLSQADAKAKIKNYADAIMIYQKAKTFCNNTTGMVFDDAANSAMNSSINGQYSLLVQEAKGWFSKGDWDKTDMAVSKAKMFAANYPGTISSTADADQITLDVKKRIYTLAIANGKNFLKNKVYSKAFEQLNKAQEIENSYAIVKDATLKESLKQAAKAVIIDNMALAQTKVSDLKGATASLLKADSMRTKYGLSDDQQVNTSIANLRNKVMKQECINLQADYDRTVVEAIALEGGKDFIKASAKYTDAVNLSNTKPACGLNTLRASNRIKEIANVVSFQLSLLDVEKFQNSAEYVKAIDAYNNAAFIFESQKLASFNLTCLPLLDYLMNHPNPDYILSGAEFYLNRNEEENALKMVKESIRKGISLGYTRDIQTKLGASLAVKDHKQSPGLNYKTKAEEHISGNPDLKYLKKAYLKQWKKF